MADVYKKNCFFVLNIFLDTPFYFYFSICPSSWPFPRFLFLFFIFWPDLWIYECVYTCICPAMCLYDRPSYCFSVPPGVGDLVQWPQPNGKIIQLNSLLGVVAIMDPPPTPQCKSCKVPCPLSHPLGALFVHATLFLSWLVTDLSLAFFSRLFSFCHPILSFFLCSSLSLN